VLWPWAQVQDEARRTFGPLLERQTKAERIKQVLGLIRRYEAVVRLPSRVREHAQARDYEQVGVHVRCRLSGNPGDLPAECAPCHPGPPPCTSSTAQEWTSAAAMRQCLLCPPFGKA
jgi:hypothetical protein